MSVFDFEGQQSGYLRALHPAVARFSAAIDAYPAGFSGNPLNLLFLEDAVPIQSPRDYLRQLDAPPLVDERRQYVLGGYPSWPFPVLSLRERPDPWLVSRRLFERFDEAAQILPTQRDTGRIIESKVRQCRPDIVVVIIVDGLSYYDLPGDTDAEPCLVDGVSITEFGYRQVVGSPEISRRLFAMDYKRQIGYTYFSPDPETLASDILSQFSSSQIVKVRAFDEILEHLGEEHLGKGYVQISMPGLDQLCHAHRDRPPREHYLRETMRRFERLVDCLAKQKRRLLAIMTADHGILWREAIEDKVEIVGDILPEDSRHPRYLEGHFLRDYGRCRTGFGKNYTLLRAPCLTRNLRGNEWGVHGGISAWESVVPLMIRLA
jgi:hypothetical protein